MAVSERERRTLQEALVASIGPEPTDTLLGYLPPVGWADVATKRDLDAVSAELGGEIRRLDDKIDALEGRLNGRIDAVAAQLNGRMDTLAAATMGKFAEIEGRFAEIEGRFAQIDGRFAQIDGRFAEIDGRFAEIAGNFTGVQGRIDGVAGALEAKMERGFKVLVFWMVSLQIAAVGAILGVPALLHR